MIPPLEPPPSPRPREVDATGDEEATGAAVWRPKTCWPNEHIPAMKASGSKIMEVVVDAADENDASAPIAPMECDRAGVASRYSRDVSSYWMERLGRNPP